jgi:predicted NUDIX family NTP pyrophosphohydrolase
MIKDTARQSNPIRFVPKKSAALLPFRYNGDTLEVFLVHPGGPYWAAKDNGAWSLPKGEYGDNEEPIAAARREFSEETGFTATGEFLPLDSARQKSGKVITAWAFRGDFDAAQLQSNLFSMEWPPRSGTIQSFPEVDRGAWFSIEMAQTKLINGQRPFLRTLVTLIESAAHD